MGMRWFQHLMNWVGVNRCAPDLDGRPAAEPGQPRERQDQSMRDTGSGNVQIGQAGGNVRVVHLNQHRHVTQVVHQHFYPTAAAGTSSQAPASAPAAQPPAANDGIKLTPEQREVYVLMRKLHGREYNRVVSFMREQLGTGLVHQLHGKELYRLRRYVEVVRRNQEGEQA